MLYKYKKEILALSNEVRLLKSKVATLNRENTDLYKTSFE